MSDPAAPGVSYVLPVLNEAERLADAVAAILAQEYPGPAEVIVALGRSTDGTDAVAERLAAQDPRIRLVANPDSSSPAGLNRAIDVSRHPIIVRVDSHTELPPGYTATMVAALERTGAAVVGGIMHAVGTEPFQQAVARAYNSPFGLGGGAYHGRATEGEADSAYLGVFRREVFTEVGRYDESLVRGQDWELASRIRAAGGRVWLVPSVRVRYAPRRTWRRLAQQFFATGVFRGHVVRRQGRTPLRYLAPPLLVAGLAAAPLATAVLGTGRLGTPGRIFAGALAAGPGAYLAGLAVASGRLGGRDAADHARNVVVLATMHTAWGAGFWRGWLAGTGGVVDRSRVSAR